MAPATGLERDRLDLLDAPGPLNPPVPIPMRWTPLGGEPACASAEPADGTGDALRAAGKRRLDRDRSVVRLPAYEAVKDDAGAVRARLAHLHLESNPGNARALVQRHGDRDLWLNPPPIPLTTPRWTGSTTCPTSARASSGLWRCEASPPGR
jgi:hypothetical protein